MITEIDTPKRPSRVYLDVTNACQLRCRHCCTSSGTSLDGELTTSEILDAVDQVHQLGIGNLVISGGEPLLHPELIAILKHARGLRLHTTILTNGLLIDRVWASRLVALGVRVKISLDGATASTHDALRGRGTFARTCEVLELLAAVGARDLTIHYTVHRKNFAELALLPDLLRELAVTNVVIGTIKPSGRALANKALLIPPQMVPLVQQKIRLIKKRAGSLDFLQYQDRGWDGFGCPATCNKLGITATGRLTTCAFFGQELLGDSIREHSLQQLWRRHLQRGEIFVANERCASCSGLSRCGGGCRARALYYRGDLNAVDPYCCAMVGKQTFISEHRELLLAARDNPLGGFERRCAQRER